MAAPARISVLTSSAASTMAHSFANALRAAGRHPAFRGDNEALGIDVIEAELLRLVTVSRQSLNPGCFTPVSAPS